MAQRMCSIDGCERRHHCRGWCSTHYERFRIHGDAQAGRSVRIWHDDEARFWSKVEKADPGDCWLWTGVIDQAGYGRIDLGKTNYQAHRFSYEINVGPIPEGLEIDHVHAWGCRHHHCVNPAHLEAVTGAENKRRRWEVSRA